MPRTPTSRTQGPEGWLQRPTAVDATIQGVRMPGTGLAAEEVDTGQADLTRDRIVAGKQPTAVWQKKLARRQ
eukprot:8517133-Lingulodinium_polyedra.AAC.1